MVASALNNSKQPEKIKWFCRLPVAMQDIIIKLYKMKKNFTMCLGLALTAVVFAADRRPDVTIISMKKYEIVIDGKKYFSNNRMMNIDNLRKLGKRICKTKKQTVCTIRHFRKQYQAYRTLHLRRLSIFRNV